MVSTNACMTACQSTLPSSRQLTHLKPMKLVIFEMNSPDTVSQRHNPILRKAVLEDIADIKMHGNVFGMELVDKSPHISGLVGFQTSSKFR